jgi:hypothetical protein
MRRSYWGKFIALPQKRERQRDAKPAALTGFDSSSAKVYRVFSSAARRLRLFNPAFTYCEKSHQNFLSL